MPKWLIVLITALVAPVFLGLGGWGLIQASNNKAISLVMKTKHEQDMINIRLEYGISQVSLTNIEKGIEEISGKQDAFNTKMGEMSSFQAVVNQKLIGHITVDDQRVDRLQDRIDKHTH